MKMLKSSITLVQSIGADRIRVNRTPHWPRALILFPQTSRNHLTRFGIHAVQALVHELAIWTSVRDQLHSIFRVTATPGCPACFMCGYTISRTSEGIHTTAWLSTTMRNYPSGSKAVLPTAVVNYVDAATIVRPTLPSCFCAWRMASLEGIVSSGSLRA